MFIFVGLYPQSVINKTDINPTGTKVFGALLLDKDTQRPLPYANIHVLNTNRGTVSNEMGNFTIDIAGLDRTDTLRFQYIGYATLNIPLSRLDTVSVVFMKEEIFNLSETVIFAHTPNVESIIRNVIKNKDSNYRPTTSLRQTFIRERYTSDFDKVRLTYKKSSIADLNRDLIKLMEDKMPKHSTSYTDFLGYLYTSGVEDDSIKLKIDPIRAVSLKEKDIAELNHLETIFKNIFANTDKEEYWKIKSGILSQKMEIDNTSDSTENDTINDNARKVKYFQRSTAYKFKYSTLENKDEWEFLYSPSKYDYTLVGGTRVNGEDVYIIDFAPRKSGNFRGRVYISIDTYALIRADYEYAPGKIGRDFQLFGVGYTENAFAGSIYFEKRGDNYLLKYYSKKAGSYVSFDRDVSMLKKKERFLFDKKIKEIKVGVDISLTSESSIEMLILEETDIPHEQFINFEQDEFMDIIYVDQFDDKLWRGFSIIEPTQQMKEYKKQMVDYND